jgi:hypothetical protein
MMETTQCLPLLDSGKPDLGHSTNNNFEKTRMSIISAKCWIQKPVDIWSVLNLMKNPKIGKVPHPVRYIQSRREIPCLQYPRSITETPGSGILSTLKISVLSVMIEIIYRPVLDRKSIDEKGTFVSRQRYSGKLNN